MKPIFWLRNSAKPFEFKENGLIHKSNLADVYVEDPSEFIALHEHVSVQVMEVDIARKRIGLKRLV